MFGGIGSFSYKSVFIHVYYFDWLWFKFIVLKLKNTYGVANGSGYIYLKFWKSVICFVSGSGVLQIEIPILKITLALN